MAISNRSFLNDFIFYSHMTKLKSGHLKNGFKEL